MIATAAAEVTRPETRVVAASGTEDETSRAAGQEPGQAEVARLRDEIERIDRDLVMLIAARVQVAHAIGAAKRAAGMPTVDTEREAAIIRRSAALARNAGVSTEAVRDIFWRLVGLARRAQLEQASNA